MGFISKLRGLLAKRRIEAEMAEEMRLHLELQAEKNLAEGMAPEEARYAAQRQFGGIEQIKERCREQRAWVWLEQTMQDLRYAVRALRKTPGFTVAAVVTLGLGIGVNSTTFSIINDLIVQPYFRDREVNLVALHTVRTSGERSYRAFNHAEFTLLRSATAVFSDVAAMQFGTCLLGEPEDLRRRMVCLVSENYFSVLGVRPVRGRFFSAAEAGPTSGAQVLVASHNFWQRSGGDENFVGSTVRIDGRNFTVIGVAPAGFGGLHWSNGPEAWLPLGVAPSLPGLWGSRRGSSGLLDPRWQMLQLFGSLRPGLTMEGARGVLSPLSEQLNELGGLGAADARMLTLSSPTRINLELTWPNDESGLTIYAAAAVGMTVTVLLIACLNVANMLFGRSLVRQREISIRLCLGASRGRVVRQLLMEGFLIACAGGATGLLLSRWSNHLLLSVGGEHSGTMTMHLRTTLNWPLLAGTFALCLLSTLVVSLAPALRATRRDLSGDLKKQPGETAAAGVWNRFFSLRNSLAMAQLALSLLLVFSAGLMVRSVTNSERDRGFETDGRLVANLDYFLAQTPPDVVALRQRAALERASRLPGVASAALASAVPHNFESSNRRIFAVGGRVEEGKSDSGQGAGLTVVSHRYFETMGIPLLRGRDFTANEALEADGRGVAIIDDSLGRALFGDADPLGRHVALSKVDAESGDGGRQLEIVGIVRSPREDAFQPDKPYRRIYRPLGQARPGMLNTYVHVRLEPAVAAPPMIDALRRDLRSVDPETPLLVCESLAAFIGKNLNVWAVRLLAAFFGVFGSIAVALTVVGVYGVKAYLVARRAREIGIRIAIGANGRDILGLLLKQSVLQTALGVGVGVGLALLAGQFLSKLLYRVQAMDATVLLGAVGLLATVSLLAGLIPAWRAMRIDPNEALRTE